MINRILLKLQEYSVSQGDEAACEYLNDTISWRDLDHNTDRMALEIRKLINNKKQVPILIYHSRNIKFIEFMIAVLKCGCYYVPLEHSIPVERVKYIYEDVGATLILTDKVGIFDLQQYKATALDEPEELFVNKMMQTDIDVHDLVYVMYTSGTSGQPKGVKIMYSNLINLVESFFDIVYQNFNEPKTVGVLASFSFDASVKQIYCSLYYGHTLCIADETVKNFGRKLHTFHNKYNLAVCDATPSHVNLMTMQKAKSISKLPFILIGGEVLRWEILHKYIQFACFVPTFINVYGPTECCVDVAYKVISKDDLEKNYVGIVPIGKSIRNTTLSIHSEDGVIIGEEGRNGELLISGRQVGAGYIVNKHFITFSNKNGEGVYKTGDIAFLNQDSEFVVIGRKDTQVKINGYRIELSEIQSAVEHFLTCSCATFCINKEEFTKVVVFICRSHFSKDEKYHLEEHLRSIFPIYMLPHYYFIGDSMPLTENGKVDIKALQYLFYKEKDKMLLDNNF